VQHVQLAKEATDEPVRTEHRRLHRVLSAELTTDLAASVVLRNRRGDEVALPALLQRRQQQLSISRRPPWGVGDCAAPKLLHAAHALGLCPTGLAELWHVPPSRRGSGGSGGSGGSRGREHGSLHPACQERCEPIMGFLLCGLEVDEDEDSAPDPERVNE